MSKRFGQMIRLKPRGVEEYISHHAAVWPAVLSTIKDCNVCRQSDIPELDMVGPGWNTLVHSIFLLRTRSCEDGQFSVCQLGASYVYAYFL